jgi:hypothetical protein
MEVSPSSSRIMSSRIIDLTLLTAYSMSRTRYCVGPLRDCCREGRIFRTTERGVHGTLAVLGRLKQPSPE